MIVNFDQTRLLSITIDFFIDEFEVVPAPNGDYRPLEAFAIELPVCFMSINVDEEVVAVACLRGDIIGLAGRFVCLYKLLSMLCSYYVCLCLGYYLTRDVAAPPIDSIVYFTRSIVLLVREKSDKVRSVTVSLGVLTKRYV